MFRKLKIGETDLCNCGLNPETADHILHACQLYQEEREKIWPTETALRPDLRGSMDDLKRITQFIEAIGAVTCCLTEER